MPGPSASAEPVRLHRFIAQCGLCSRRKAEEMITEGRVQVNGELVTTLGTKVTARDHVLVDGQEITPQATVTAVLYKPKGVVTTMADPQGRPTVAKYVPPIRGAILKPVGRLDQESDGLLVVTSDGDLAARLSHARYGIDKEYRVTVTGIPDDQAIERMRKGIVLDGKRTAPAHIRIINRNEKANVTVLEFILHEGRRRQIRRMCEDVGHPVQALRRVRIGPLTLRGMAPGECRLLSQQEVSRLRALVGLR